MRCKRELEDVQPGRRHRHGCRRVTHSRILASSYEGVIGEHRTCRLQGTSPKPPNLEICLPGRDKTRDMLLRSSSMCYYVLRTYSRAHESTAKQAGCPGACGPGSRIAATCHPLDPLDPVCAHCSRLSRHLPLPPCRLVLVTPSLDTRSSRHRDKPPTPRKRCQPCSVAPNSLSTCSAEQHRMTENTGSSVVGSWPRPSLSQIASDQFQTGQAVGCPAPCAAPPFVFMPAVCLGRLDDPIPVGTTTIAATPTRLSAHSLYTTVGTLHGVL